MTMHAQPLGPSITSSPLEIKSINADGTFEGFASLFGREDLGRDIIEKGAFSDCLSTRGARGVKMLFQHDPSQLIGVWQELKEVPRGLYVRGRLLADVSKAQEVLSLMLAGALDGLSIGFRTIKARTDRKNGVRYIQKVDLWEVSIVTFPMQPLARVSTVKTHGEPHEISQTALAIKMFQAANMFKISP